MRSKTKQTEVVTTANQPVRQVASELPSRQIGIYNIRDIMMIFGVTRRTISNWQSSGKLSYVKVGNLLYITREQLQEFIEDNTVVGYKRYGRNAI